MPHRTLIAAAVVSSLSFGACAPTARSTLATDDPVAAMESGLDVDASEAKVEAYSRRVFALMDIEAWAETKDPAELEGELDAVLQGRASIQTRWTATEPGKLVVDATEPISVVEVGGAYLVVPKMEPLFVRELAAAVGEEEMVKTIEQELSRGSRSGGGDANGDPLSCRAGEHAVRSVLLCLWERSGKGERAATPLEVRTEVSRFLSEYADRLPKTRRLHADLHDSDVTDTKGGVEGRRAVTVQSYARDDPQSVDGTAFVLSVECLGCDGFPHPGAVTALVYLPLSVWAPGDRPLQIWPPPAQADVRYGGRIARGLRY